MESLEAVHLLLRAPGQEPLPLPESRWSMWVLTPEGPQPPDVVAGSTRLSGLSPRGERALVAAVASDDIDELRRLAASAGAVGDMARLLLVGRLATCDVPAAVDAIGPLRADGCPWSSNKVLRRLWRTLHLHVALAPGVPALVPIGAISLGLKHAELLVTAGRTAESVAVLEFLPREPATTLALAAALLANGECTRVLELTRNVQNLDDLTALLLVAASVAARVEGDLDRGFDAVTAALSVPLRHRAVIAGALEERAHLSSLARDDTAVRADLEALAALSNGQVRVDVPTVMRRRRTEADDREILARARTRMRRRITGTGEPGTFGGRHHSTYRDEIVDMFALGQAAAAEELLLGLLDAVEDEVAELGVELDPTFFVTLADLYGDSGRTEDLRALRERFAAAESRAEAACGEAGERGTTLYPTPTDEVATSELEAMEPEVSAAVEEESSGLDWVEAIASEPVIDGTGTEPSLDPEEASESGATVDEVLATTLELGWPDDSTDPHEEDLPLALEWSSDDELSSEGQWLGDSSESSSDAHDDEDRIPALDGCTEGAEGGAVEERPEASDGDGEDRPPSPPERELTLVERTIRGPRLRTL